MKESGIDASLLREFESGLDPRRPEAGPIPARILDHGEITTVLEIVPPARDGGSDVAGAGVRARAPRAARRLRSACATWTPVLLSSAATGWSSSNLSSSCGPLLLFWCGSSAGSCSPT
ncbi:MAG: hypothetical protein ACYCX3_04440 [Thermoleophilia bacterium]